MAPHPSSGMMMMEYENPDGTKEYPEATMTRIFSTRSSNFLPQKPTTTFPLQYSAPLVSSDSFATIPAASMKQVGVGYGGLKGYAYVQSMQEFVEGCGGEALNGLVRQRADKVSKGVYSFEQAVNVIVKNSDNRINLCKEQPLPIMLDLSATDEELLENNQQIIAYLSHVRTGRVKEEFTDAEQELLQRLHSQISLLASRQNNTAIINKLSK